MSPYQDGFFVLKVTDYDYTWQSEKKVEIISIISEVWSEINDGRRLPINFMTGTIVGDDYGEVCVGGGVACARRGASICVLPVATGSQPPPQKKN